MSEARATILARLRDAQRTARLPGERPGTPRSLEFASRSPEECLERFQKELTTLGVETYLEASAADVRNRVMTLVAGRRLLSWDPELLPYQLASLLTNFILGRNTREEQAAAEIGLTGCDAAIAETGSLVLLSGKGKSRAVSLLPTTHVAVVRRGDLYFSMGEFFRKSAEQLAESAGCTIITGPSRTADIELSLTLAPLPQSDRSLSTSDTLPVPRRPPTPHLPPT